MWPDTRGRTSTDCGASRRPVNSSNSWTWRWTAGATETGGGPNPPGGTSALDWQAASTIDPASIRTPRPAGDRSARPGTGHDKNKPLDMIKSSEFATHPHRREPPHYQRPTRSDAPPEVRSFYLSKCTEVPSQRFGIRNRVNIQMRYRSGS